jgi:hypothetical protein
MEFDFVSCKEIEELKCLYCIHWKDGQCITSKPPWEITDAEDSCGDGYWVCEVWKFNKENSPIGGGYWTEELLTRTDFIDAKLYEFRHRDYAEREKAAHDKNMKDWAPKTTKEKFEHFEHVIKRFSEDLYAIKEKLGLNYG